MLFRSATSVRYIVAGIGLNVNHTEFPPELDRIATSLRIVTGREWSRIEICAAVLKSLEREYKNLVTNVDSRADILERVEERSCSICGREVWIEENPQWTGITEGLDDRGFLRLRTRDGLKTVYGGTVRWK